MKYNRTYFESLAEELSTTVSQPSFVARMDAVRRAPAAERIGMAAAVAPVNLRALGLAVPETFRVSVRSFEDPAFAAGHGAQKPGFEPGFEPGSEADARMSTPMESMGSMDAGAFDGSTWGQGSDDLPDAPATPDVIRATVHRAVLDIADAVLAAPFYQALTELYALAPAAQHQFVLDVFLDEQECRRRAIVLPTTMRVQRSTFYDGRPTLFCVSKKENLAYPWRKITVTFDSDDAASTAVAGV